MKSNQLLRRALASVFVCGAAVACQPSNEPTSQQPTPEVAQKSAASTPYDFNGFRAENKNHGFSAEVDDAGLTLESFVSQQIRFELTGFGRPEAVNSVWRTIPQIEGALATWDRGTNIKEWWANGGQGLEQGFDISAAPDEGGEELVFDIAVTGVTFKTHPKLGVVMELDSTGDMLTYNQLIAHDADGKPLDIRSEPTEEGIRLLVNDRDAVYPIHVDPAVSSYTYGTFPIFTRTAQYGFFQDVAMWENTVAFSQTGSREVRIYTRNGDVWDLDSTQRMIGAFSGYGDEIEFSEDGHTLYVGAGNGEISIYQRNDAGRFLQTDTVRLFETYNSTRRADITDMKAHGNQLWVGVGGDAVVLSPGMARGTIRIIEESTSNPGRYSEVARVHAPTRSTRMLGMRLDPPWAGGVGQIARINNNNGVYSVSHVTNVGGSSSISVGTINGEWVLAGNPSGQDASGQVVGSVNLYRVFSTALALSRTIYSPTPEVGARFGHSISMGDTSDKTVTIGEPRADVGGVVDAGEAHVYVAWPTGTSTMRVLNYDSFTAQTPVANGQFGYNLITGAVEVPTVNAIDRYTSTYKTGISVISVAADQLGLYDIDQVAVARSR